MKPTLFLVFFLIASLVSAEGHPEFANIGWLAGSWSGECFNAQCDEVWQKPAGGAMIGNFRLIKEGKPVFYEFFTIRHEGDSLVLKLRHFNPDLTGWEEKNQTVDFKFVRSTADTIEFEGLIFRKLQDEQMKVELRLKDKKTGEMRTEEMLMRRDN